MCPQNTIEISAIIIVFRSLSLFLSPSPYSFLLSPSFFPSLTLFLFFSLSPLLCLASISLSAPPPSPTPLFFLPLPPSLSRIYVYRNRAIPFTLYVHELLKLFFAAPNSHQLEKKTNKGNEYSLCAIKATFNILLLQKASHGSKLKLSKILLQRCYG